MHHHRISVCFVSWVFLLGFTQAAEHSSDTMATQITDPQDLALENVQIASETDLLDGRTLVEVTADVRNLDVGKWNDVTLKVSQESGSETPAAAITFDTVLEPGEVAIAPGTMHVLVAAADAAAARAEILAGTVLAVTATDLEYAACQGALLVIEEPRIIAETALASGQVLIEFAADVRNMDEEPLCLQRIDLLPVESGIDYDRHLGFIMVDGKLVGSGTASFQGTLPILVDTPTLKTVRAELLSGDALTLTGKELWIFNAPLRGIDAITEDAWRWPAAVAGNLTTLVFTEATDFLGSLQPGDLLVEDPGVNQLNFTDLDNPEANTLADYVPFKIESVTTIGEEIHVKGTRQLLLDVLQSGTFIQNARDAYDEPVRDPFDPSLENTYTADEQEEREDLAKIIADEDPRDGRLAELRGMSSRPWHINRFPLTKKVSVSGAFLLRSSGLQIEIKIRDFALQRASAHLDAGIVMNLLIEASGEEDNSDDPPDEKEAGKELFELELPAITLNIGGVPVVLELVTSLRVGADVDLPSGLILPLQSAGTVGVDAGWDKVLQESTGNGFFYEPFTEIIPLRVSDPGVFDDAETNLGIWAEFSISLEGDLGGIDKATAATSASLRFQSDFNVAPLADPWWSWDTGLELAAGFGLDFLGLVAIDASGTLLDLPLSHRDAGGPLIPARVGRDGEDAPRFESITANNIRWARAFLPSEKFSGFEQGFVIADPSSPGSCIVGGSEAARSAIAKFDPFGDLVWMKSLGNQPIAQVAAPLPDGGFLTAGYHFSDIVVAKFDSDGNRLRATSHRPALSFTITGIAVLESGNIVVAGHAHHGSARTSDPALIVFEPSGVPLWANYYALEGDDEVFSITESNDGMLLLGGRTDANVAIPELGTPDSENKLKDATPNGLLMEVDPNTGALRWAYVYASRWEMRFEAVAQAPDGTIYAAGRAPRVVSQDRPAMLVAKFEADGTLIDHVTIGDDPDIEDELPDGGNTPYDTVGGLAWSKDGLFASGTTGLGEERAGFLLGLTEELGVRFFSVLDGARGEIFHDISIAEDGVFISGTTRSAYPWGIGGRSTNLIAKLPWEGTMRFHEDSGLDSLFLRPQVYHSSGSLEFLMVSSVENGPAFTTSFSPINFQPNALALTPGGTVRPIADATDPIVLSLAEGNRAEIENFGDWASYHRLSGDASAPDSDPDGDGIANVLEAFFGTSPYIAKAEPVAVAQTEIDGRPAIVIEFERSLLSSSLGVQLQADAGLGSWTDASGWGEDEVPIDGESERVRVIVPTDVPARFFRFAAGNE